MVCTSSVRLLLTNSWKKKRSLEPNNLSSIMAKVNKFGGNSQALFRRQIGNAAAHGGRNHWQWQSGFSIGRNRWGAISSVKRRIQEVLRRPATVVRPQSGKSGCDGMLGQRDCGPIPLSGHADLKRAAERAPSPLKRSSPLPAVGRPSPWPSITDGTAPTFTIWRNRLGAVLPMAIRSADACAIAAILPKPPYFT